MKIVRTHIVAVHVVLLAALFWATLNVVDHYWVTAVH